MDKNQLNKDLQALLQAVEELPLEHAERRRLNALISTIESHVAGEPVAAIGNELNDTVDQLVSTFDASHPTLSGVLKNVMQSLGNMGV